MAIGTTAILSAIFQGEIRNSQTTVCFTTVVRVDNLIVFEPRINYLFMNLYFVLLYRIIKKGTFKINLHVWS